MHFRQQVNFAGDGTHRWLSRPSMRLAGEDALAHEALSRRSEHVLTSSADGLPQLPSASRQALRIAPTRS